MTNHTDNGPENNESGDNNRIARLIALIDSFSLKTPSKDTWVVHSRDIVINRSAWRDIKRQYFADIIPTEPTHFGTAGQGDDYYDTMIPYYDPASPMAVCGRDIYQETRHLCVLDPDKVTCPYCLSNIKSRKEKGVYPFNKER